MVINIIGSRDWIGCLLGCRGAARPARVSGKNARVHQNSHSTDTDFSSILLCIVDCETEGGREGGRERAERERECRESGSAETHSGKLTPML